MVSPTKPKLTPPVIDGGTANHAAATSPEPPAQRKNTQSSGKQLPHASPHRPRTREWVKSLYKMLCSSPAKTHPDEQRAALLLTKRMRLRVAASAYKNMLENGDLWKSQQHITSIPELSKTNLRNLRTSLKKLDEDEKAFLSKFLKTDFYATHSTSVNLVKENGTAFLFSKKKLMKRGISFDMKNSMSGDIHAMGNDDFVFFSLECGQRPKKPSSRFGKILLRFSFQHKAFSQAGWMSLGDMAAEESERRFLQDHIKDLASEEYEKLNRQRVNTTDRVFYGKDMIVGLALSILKDCRTNLSPESRQRILSMHTDEQFNSLINGFYRPEVKVPRHFFAKPVEFNLEKFKVILNQIISMSSEQQAFLLSKLVGNLKHLPPGEQRTEAFNKLMNAVRKLSDENHKSLILSNLADNLDALLASVDHDKAFNAILDAAEKLSDEKYRSLILSNLAKIFKPKL